MSVTILDSATAATVALADNQEDQLSDLIAPWVGGNATVRVLAGDTLLATVTQAPFTLNTTVTPRALVVGARLARTFVAGGTPTRAVFRAGSTDIFQIAAEVGSGPISFVTAITEAALERLDGLTILGGNGLPTVPTLNLSSSAPNRVVVEDWSSGSAVDVGTITLGTLIRADRFADPNLAADCTRWLEYGPASATGLPALNGVQFSAKGFDIRAGGQYGQRSFRILVMMRALGLQDGILGPIEGVPTYPGPHKLRIVSVAGTVLKTIEMRDGLPMNHSSLVNIPYNWTVSDRPTATISITGRRLADDKAMRPWMSAGSSYVAFFGDTPSSSTGTRNRIPRVKSSWPTGANSKYRALYNGEDVHVFDDVVGNSGNGNAHPEVLPRWAMTRNAIVALAVVQQNDPSISNGNSGGGNNWANALRLGWDYEPGCPGGITRRGGPGGVRIDRTVLPQEIYQMALSSTTRLNDNTPTADMARGFALNHANYPGYYPRSMVTLDAINTFSSSPQPTIAGTDYAPVYHYYGSNGPTDQPGAIWVWDSYGAYWETIAQAIELPNPGTGSAQTTFPGHVRNGWMPDGEHVNRTGAVWATLLYADPLFARMAEHLMFESQIMQPGLAKGQVLGYGSDYSGHIADPSAFWQSRSNLLPFCTAAAMWWVASKNGVYSRTQIEDKFHAWCAVWHNNVGTQLPATAVTPGQKIFPLAGNAACSYQTWGSSGNYSAGEGWVVMFGLPMMYIGNLFMILKVSGLHSVLRANATTATVLDNLEKLLELNARMFVSCPWAACNGGILGPCLLLRTAAQGAVSGNLSTIPTSHAQIATYNPALRGDSHWYLNSGATPGVSNVSYVGSTYAGYGRMQTARMWWDLYAPAGSERTAALATCDAQIAALSNYTPVFQDPCFARHNFAQVVPALSS